VSDKRLILTVGTGLALLIGWRALRTGTDPIPQLAGTGAVTLALLFAAEAAPKLASGFAVLLAVAFALNYQQTGGNK
jgi:hypothetical protein